MQSYPSIPSAPHHGSHRRATTLDAAHPRRQRKDHPSTLRPSTADTSQLPPTLPLIGKGVDDFLGQSFNIGLDKSHFPGQTVTTTPIIRLQRVSTPEPCPVPPAHVNPDPNLEITFPEDPGGLPVGVEPLVPTHYVEAFNRDDLFIKYGPDGLVRTGTLPGLVERLILDSRDFGKDNEYRETFLTSYRSFTNADEVLRLLLERFESVSSPLHTAEQRAGMRYSVLKVLALWLQGDHVEAKDIHLLERMRGFVATVEASSVPVFRESAQRLIQLIDHNLDTFLSPVPPLTPSSSSSSLKTTRTVSEITPQVLAIVLTSIEGDRYRKLMEFDGIDWLEAVHGSNAISSYIAENKKISYWAQRAVLRRHLQSDRAENLRYFLCVIQECRKLRNFSSACALTCGLAVSSITGLKRTYGELDKPNAKIFKEAQQLISIDMNFKAYRAALNESKEACIPWLYVHLRDLNIIHRAYPLFVDEDGRKELINFGQCRRIRGRIRDILGYQAPLVDLTDRVHFTRMQTLVNAQLDSWTVDDGLCNWLQDRGEKLAREEMADFETHEEELRRAGFIRRTPTASAVAPPLRAYNPVPYLRSSATPQRETRLSPTTPSDTHKEVTRTVFSLDVFDKHSERCLDGRIIRLNQYPVAFGGYADVWEGLIGERKVAIKTLRHFSSNGKRIEENKLLKRLWREYSAWTWVSHPIVLECLGFTFDFSPDPYKLPSLISPWMSNGTLNSYLEKNEETDRLNLLLDVADGLSFLHDQHPAIIHGDLRGGNILISDSGRPCLSDFGLSKVLRLEGMTTTAELAGSLRWMSPELLRDEVVASTSSDVWAYGMTILEVMSGRIPYFEVKNDPAVLAPISQGQIPLRPQVSAILTDDVWAICQKCWNIAPRQRPSMREVFLEIGRIDQ